VGFFFVGGYLSLEQQQHFFLERGGNEKKKLTEEKGDVCCLQQNAKKWEVGRYPHCVSQEIPHIHLFIPTTRVPEW
jgi:hypothetical protein